MTFVFDGLQQAQEWWISVVLVNVVVEIVAMMLRKMMKQACLMGDGVRVAELGSVERYTILFWFAVVANQEVERWDEGQTY